MIVLGLLFIGVGIALSAYQYGRDAERRASSAMAKSRRFVVPLPPRPIIMPTFAAVPMVPMEDVNHRIMAATMDGYEQGCRTGLGVAFESHVKINLN